MSYRVYIGSTKTTKPRYLSPDKYVASMSEYGVWRKAMLSGAVKIGRQVDESEYGRVSFLGFGHSAAKSCSVAAYMEVDR